MIEQLGRYRLTARIATGGMAEVFLARAEGVQGFAKTVVIKRLLPHLTREPQVVEMFLNEAKLTGRLDHANIVGVIDLGQAAGHYFIAMEFLDGRAVAEVRDAARGQGGMLPIGFVLKIFSEALAGLHHAHEARGEEGQPLGVVHRDFNPDNIVVTYDGRVKVVDFGIAKSQNAASSTEPGTLKGKYFYMSPEMVLGNPLDRRADIFATGVALYELLCDKRPYEGDTPNAILSGIAYGTPVSPRSLNPTIPAELESLILRCMARSPNERPPTALAVKEEIDLIAPRVGAFGPAEVSQLMELLFPPTDSERARIADLRKIDPSMPDQALLPIAPPPPAPVAVEPLAKTRRPKTPGKPLPVKKIGIAAGVVAGAALLVFGGIKVVSAVRGPPTAQEKHLAQLEAAYKAKASSASAGDAYAEALLKAGRDGDAEEVLGKVLAAHDKDVRAHVLMGDLWTARRYGQKAFDEYGKALAINPDDATALAHQGALHLARGEIPDAKANLVRALSLRKGDRDLSLQVADLQGRTGDWPGAVNTLGDAVQRSPRDAVLRQQLGFAYYQSNDDRHAQQELEQARRLQPESVKAALYLGYVYYRQGRTEKAIDSYRASIAHAKTPIEAAQAHAALGQILAAKGDKTAAKQELGAAVKADPSLTEAKSALQKLQ